MKHPFISNVRSSSLGYFFLVIITNIALAENLQSSNYCCVGHTEPGVNPPSFQVPCNACVDYYIEQQRIVHGVKWTKILYYDYNANVSTVGILHRRIRTSILVATETHLSLLVACSCNAYVASFHIQDKCKYWCNDYESHSNSTTNFSKWDHLHKFGNSVNFLRLFINFFHNYFVILFANIYFYRIIKVTQRPKIWKTCTS